MAKSYEDVMRVVTSLYPGADGVTVKTIADEVTRRAVQEANRKSAQGDTRYATHELDDALRYVLGDATIAPHLVPSDIEKYLKAAAALPVFQAPQALAAITQGSGAAQGAFPNLQNKFTSEPKRRVYLIEVEVLDKGILLTVCENHGRVFPGNLASGMTSGSTYPEPFKRVACSDAADLGNTIAATIMHEAITAPTE